MTPRIEDRVVTELDNHGPMERMALASLLGAKPQEVSRALYGLKQAGLVRPVGDRRWATCSSPLEYPAASLPEGEGVARVERRPPPPLADPVDDEPLEDLELDDIEVDEDREPRGVSPPFGPDQRGPVWDVTRVDVERLRADIFGAMSATRSALDMWVSSDPVAYRLKQANAALTYARRLIDELEA